MGRIFENLTIEACQKVFMRELRGRMEGMQADGDGRKVMRELKLFMVINACIL